jgi:hypothetical protein
MVPLEIVQDLLCENLDMVEFADVAAVIHLRRDLCQQKIDLKQYCLYTREDDLFVGLRYAGFEGKRQNVQ